MTDDDVDNTTFTEDDINNKREPFDPSERGKISNFVWAVLRTDEDSYRELPKLVEEYRRREPLFRAGIDEAFMALCGWSFVTIINAAELGVSLDDASERLKALREI
jgi:hypothetical protein